MDDNKKGTMLYSSLQKLMEHGYYKDCFYEAGWCVYYLLNSIGQHNRPGKSTHSRVFCNDISFSPRFNKVYGCDSPMDETVAISSNVLHANVYSYLWGAEGQNVYLNPEEEASYDETIEADFKLKKAITDDKHFNSAIRVALKNCIDYGVGYVFTDKDFYQPIHPLSIQKCIKGKEVCYIYEQEINKSSIHNDDTAHYVYGGNNGINEKNTNRRHERTVYIFGQEGKFSKMLGLKITSKYFMVKLHTYKDKTITIEKLKEEGMPFLHEIALPYYEDELGMSIGCGIKSLDSAIALIDITRHTKASQEIELNPYAIITSPINLEGRKGLAAGTFHTVDEYTIEGAPPVMYPAPARASNSSGYIEAWRNNIRSCYVLGSVGNTGRGQTTAIEASTNYSSISAMIKGIIRPFDWFIVPLINRFIENNRKELQKNININYSKAKVVLLGGVRSSDIIERVSTMLQSIQGVASITGALDPTSSIMFKAPAIIYGMLGNEVPKWFLLSSEEYAQAAQIAQQMMEQQIQQEQQ